MVPVLDGKFWSQNTLNLHSSSVTFVTKKNSVTFVTKKNSGAQPNHHLV